MQSILTMSKKLFIVPLVLIACISSGVSFADVPSIISFSGQISDSNGPLDASPNITFTMYKDDDGDGICNGGSTYLDSSGCTSVWTETHNAVSVSNGLFAVELGSSTPLSDVNFKNPKLLGINVNGDGVMNPLTRFTSVPTAIRAQSTKGSTVTVDCNSGDSIMDAINAGASTITISGACQEQVIIKRDKVTIQGNSGDAQTDSIVGPADGDAALKILGANLVNIVDLEISDMDTTDFECVHIYMGATAIFESVSITDTCTALMEIAHNSSLLASNSFFGGFVEDGIVVADSSSLELSSSTVTTSDPSALSGILVGSSSAAIIGNEDASGNDVNIYMNNGGTALVVEESSSAELANVNIDVLTTNDWDSGILVLATSRVEMESTTIDNDNGNGVYISEGGSFMAHGTNSIDVGNVGIDMDRAGSAQFHEGNITSTASSAVLMNGHVSLGLSGSASNTTIRGAGSATTDGYGHGYGIECYAFAMLFNWANMDGSTTAVGTGDIQGPDDSHLDTGFGTCTVSAAP